MYPYIHSIPPVGPFHSDWIHITNSLMACLMLLLSGLLFLPFSRDAVSTLLTRSLRCVSHIDRRSKWRVLKSLCVIVYIRLSASSKATEAPMPASGDIACAASPRIMTLPLGLCQCLSSGTSKNLPREVNSSFASNHGARGVLRMTIKILTRLFLHHLSDMLWPVLTAKSLKKHLLLFIPPCHKVGPVLLVLAWEGEC